MPASGWKKLSSEEIRLAKEWYLNRGMSPTQIAKQLGRDRSVMTRLLVKQAGRRRQGRPVQLSEGQIAFLVKTLHELILEADVQYRVTVAMLKKATRTKASTRVILNALHKKNIYFRALREKPQLTTTDIKERYAFAQKYAGKSKQWWIDKVHASIDGKFFKPYLTGNARKHAAQHATYGAFRAPGKGLAGGYVKPKRGTHYNTGVKSILVVGAIGAGKVMMWHTVPSGRWSGQAAADMYQGPLHKALTATYPGKRKFSVLEDNDPTGFKSRKGVDAKVESNINVFEIPKRSPDLNVLDYAVWKQVNVRLRRQEKNWPAGKRESRDQYCARLQRTAKRLPQGFINRSVADMHRRCQRLLAAEGFRFEEGGRGTE